MDLNKKPFGEKDGALAISTIKLAAGNPFRDYNEINEKLSVCNAAHTYTAKPSRCAYLSTVIYES